MVLGVPVAVIILLVVMVIIVVVISILLVHRKKERSKLVQISTSTSQKVVISTNNYTSKDNIVYLTALNYNFTFLHAYYTNSHAFIINGVTAEESLIYDNWLYKLRQDF